MNKICIWSEQKSVDDVVTSYAQYFVENDGGRAEAGFKGSVNDCTCRAIAIALELPYKEVYDGLNNLIKKRSKPKSKHGSSREGVSKRIYREYLEAWGWEWVPLMKIGQGCKTHLRGDELPKGRIIVSVSKHMTTVIDGIIHDTYDCSRGGSRCVYGYFKSE